MRPAARRKSSIAHQPREPGRRARLLAGEDGNSTRTSRGDDRPAARAGAALMTEPVKIYILDREFMIACPTEERESLLQSAAMLNQKMQEIRDKGKVVGMDRIAVLAALNLAHELLRLQQDAGGRFSA